jgi:hypothetical protein
MLRGDDKPLCSECDPKIGKWHGKFDKRSAVGMLLDCHDNIHSVEYVNSDTFPKHNVIVGIITEAGVELYENWCKESCEK